MTRWKVQVKFWHRPLYCILFAMCAGTCRGDNQTICDIEYYKYAGYCVKQISTPLTLDQANHICQYERGALATAKTSVDADLLYARCGGKDCWLGYQGNGLILGEKFMYHHQSDPTTGNNPPAVTCSPCSCSSAPDGNLRPRDDAQATVALGLGGGGCQTRSRRLAFSRPATAGTTGIIGGQDALGGTVKTHATATTGSITLCSHVHILWPMRITQKSLASDYPPATNSAPLYVLKLRVVRRVRSRMGHGASLALLVHTKTPQTLGQPA
jgi:hypothetical protein